MKEKEMKEKETKPKETKTTEGEKKRISARLAEYCSRYAAGGADRGQNKAAASLKGVSAATVSHILSGDWALIADEMWRNVAAQTGFDPRAWNAVETTDYVNLTRILTDARDDGETFAVVGDAGTGKSFALDRFARNNKRVYLLECEDCWTKREFLSELLRSMGKPAGGTVGEMMKTVVDALKRQERPLLVIDEADKLADHVLYFFITLYNKLHGDCGLVLCATDYFAERIDRGLRLRKKGYKEISSRIGRRCIPLDGVSARDIASICVANGITDKEQVREVIDDAEGDLRRVRRKIYALKKIESE